MRSVFLSRGVVASLAIVMPLTVSACNSTNSSAAPVATAEVRAVHASPDAGPVDIYIYSAGSSRPSAPTITDAVYPALTGYAGVPAGTYQIDVLAHGTAATGAAVASEQITLAKGTQYSVAVAGQVGQKTLQFVNFVEPAEVAGQTALIVHHASPAVNALVNPVGVGVYSDATLGTTAPAASATTDVFSFSLTSPSGPATSGNVVGGEFFLSPLPSTLPANIGFAAGAPGAAGSPLASVAVSATVAQLATGLTNPTSSETTLAQDTASTVPAGAHLSVFAIDASPARLIGTLDP